MTEVLLGRRNYVIRESLPEKVMQLLVSNKNLKSVEMACLAVTRI